MSDITGFAKLNPLHGRTHRCVSGGETVAGTIEFPDTSFRDQLDSLLAAARGRKVPCEIVDELKEQALAYVKENAIHMGEKAVRFPIRDGNVMTWREPHGAVSSPAVPICAVPDLDPVRKALKAEGIELEWAYDRGRYDGTLVFRW